MYPEKRVILSRLDCAIELQVVLIFQFSRLAGPQWLYIVYNLIFVGIYIFSVFPLLLLTENHRNGEEAAIFLQKCLDACLVEEFFLVIIDIEHNIGSASSFLYFVHLIFRRAVARPAHGFCTFFIRE